MKEGLLAHEGQELLSCSGDRCRPDEPRQAAQTQPRQLFATPLDQGLAAPGLIKGIALEVEVLVDTAVSLNVTGSILHPVVRCRSRLGRASSAGLLHTELVGHNIDEQASERE